MSDFLEVGRIVNTHGVKGEVKIVPLTDDPERFNNLSWVYIEKNNTLEKYTIEGIKFTKGSVVIKFKEINDMDSAVKHKGFFLKVDRKNAVKLPKDSFFICDILGCIVFTEQGEELGKLVDILKTGSNDVYVVRNENNKEILIPALKTVVKEMSVENRRMVVSLPEGLVGDEI